MTPRWLMRLLHAVLPEDRHDDVIGDLAELHGRRVDRWGRALAVLVTTGEGLGLLTSHGIRRAASALVPSGWISTIELRLALRLLFKQPVMTLTSVLALGMGIGIAAAGFGVFDQIFDGDLPFPNGDRWTVIRSYDAETGSQRRLDLERLRLFRSSAPALAYVGGALSSEYNVAHADGSVERIAGAAVTPGVFAYLPYVPVAGRLLVPGDGASGAEPVALIREGLFRRRFFGASDVDGLTLEIEGRVHEVVGVLPDDAGYPSEGEIWTPLEEESMGAADDRAQVGASRIVAILSEGATPAEAEEQIGRLSLRLSEESRGVEGRTHVVLHFTETLSTPQARVAGHAMTVVLLLFLLVIASNAANLLIARTSRRASELAVRSALGAPRSRLVGQLFVEALALGLLAAVPALAIASGVLEIYDRALDELPFWVHLSLEPKTAAVVVALGVFSAAVIGIVPGLRATRRSGGSLRVASMGIGRAGAVVIFTEVMLSVALLGAALPFAEGLRAYTTPAFDLPDERVLTARLVMEDAVPATSASASGATASGVAAGGTGTAASAPAIRVPWTAEQRADSSLRRLSAVRSALEGLPGVRAVGLASDLPRMSPWPEPVELEDGARLVRAPVVYQGPGLLEVLEVAPTVGRGIDPRDLEPDAPPVVVVNESFAQEHFGTRQVVGRRLRIAGYVEAGQEETEAPWREIVGVVPDVMEVTGSSSAAGMYVPLAGARFVSAALSVTGDPMALEGPLRRSLYDLDPRIEVAAVERLDAVGAENRVALRIMTTAMVGVGAIALLLSLAGVYAIVSLAVTRRTREIGVRVALGAEPGSLLRTVLARSVLLVVAGGSAGAGLGLVGGGADVFVFAVPDPSWWQFGALVGGMAAAATAACWVPARRALSIQPVEALRQEG